MADRQFKRETDTAMGWTLVLRFVFSILKRSWANIKHGAWMGRGARPSALNGASTT